MKTDQFEWEKIFEKATQLLAESIAHDKKNYKSN